MQVRWSVIPAHSPHTPLSVLPSSTSSPFWNLQTAPHHTGHANRPRALASHNRAHHCRTVERKKVRMNSSGSMSLLSSSRTDLSPATPDSSPRAAVLLDEISPNVVGTIKIYNPSSSSRQKCRCG
ncbi:hypothetical protein CISG_08834 [Coccidioides immitis RMSCC 3703]|uniref:Uncharacterized protein n=1 Tax=Coccidioides immitis RMSCC 3703 TaxID=454286 RepID=A0A0J8R969_COCIT|nr:hypothetical protein CISG_08834 [Coccidioides immitis RMSCC 3703]